MKQYQSVKKKPSSSPFVFLVFLFFLPSFFSPWSPGGAETHSSSFPLSLYNKYPLPDFLKGRIPESVYDKWLNAKANTLRHRDIRIKRPYAILTTKGMYKEKIHKAVVDAGQYDPYTGEPLQWELVSTWDSNEAKKGGDEYKDKFLLMPSVDHCDPKSDTLEFEIVSWLVNDCKSGLTPSQFVDLCKKIAARRGEK
jgi:hypothetical protein